ncbi:MAG TPA: IS1182 family transposase [Myxococcota bacterium]|nr:IS1182 family transposase [Myxococcota bacterium]
MTSEDDRERPRLLSPDRRQLEMRTYDLEGLLAADHRARLIWAAVERLDLSAFYAEIVARGSAPGRSATDPKLLLALWMYATSEGVGSARQLDRLCKRDDAYRWICGGVEPGYHTLSDFRVEHGEKLDELLTQVLATLTHKRLLTLKRVAQDGVRVRASAGAASFRRGHTLDKHLAEAREQVRVLKQELEADPAASSEREKAARERAASEREQKLAEALAELPKIREMRARGRRQKRSKPKPDDGKEEVRASTTDAEARVMKMGDGGFRPAVNVQYATDCETRLIVGVETTNEGTDHRQMVPMLEQVERRTGLRPSEYLVDGGYTNLGAIDEMESRGVKVYAPVPKPRKEGADPHERKREDTDRSFAWRQRMATEEAKKVYKERGAVAETVNADLRNRGLRQLPVRGQRKARCVALLYALTYDVLRVAQLAA